MKHLKLCLGYLFKSGWYVWVLWILPAIFFGLCCNPFEVIRFLSIYPGTAIQHFGDMFWLLMPISWKYIIFAVLGIGLVSIALSMAIGQMESHMRSGKLSFKEIFSYVNNNILVVLVNVVIVFVVKLVLIFLLSAILFLFQIMFSGLSNTPTIINIIFAVIGCSGYLVLMMFAISLFAINIPNMITNGYSLKEGISSSVSLIGNLAFKLACLFLLPFVIIIPVVCLLAKTNFMWIPNILFSILILSYYSVLTMTSYFEISNTNRYDNRKYYNYYK